MDNQQSENNSSDFILVNIVEVLVKDKVKELIKTIDMCQCHKCYLDACAIALNNFKPQYATTMRGELLSEVATINFHFQNELMVEVLKALVMVRDNPHH